MLTVALAAANGTTPVLETREEAATEGATKDSTAASARIRNGGSVRMSALGGFASLELAILATQGVYNLSVSGRALDQTVSVLHIIHSLCCCLITVLVVTTHNDDVHL
jgi:hypothetical protein